MHLLAVSHKSANTILTYKIRLYMLLKKGQTKIHFFVTHNTKTRRVELVRPAHQLVGYYDFYNQLSPNLYYTGQIFGTRSPLRSMLSFNRGYNIAKRSYDNTIYPCYIAFIIILKMLH